MRKKIIRYKFDESIRKELHTLRKYDNWHCFLALAEDFLFITLAILMSVHISWYLLPLSLLIIGSRQRALATILHESAHGAFAKSRRLNYIMGTFCSGYLIIQTMSSYKSSHINFHHTHFGDPEKDPDFKYSIDNGLYQDDAFSTKFRRNFITPFFLTKVPSYLKSLIKDRFAGLGCIDRREVINFSLFWLIIISLAVATGTFHYFLVFWVLPYITVFNVIGWYIELSEHYPLMKNNNNLYMTRNRHSSSLERFFLGMHNENYHLIHHLFPTIPFWNLPKAHKILMRDENYNRLDQRSGGIFFSKDNRISLMGRLKKLRKQNKKTFPETNSHIF